MINMLKLPKPDLIHNQVHASKIRNNTKLQYKVKRVFKNLRFNQKTKTTLDYCSQDFILKVNKKR